MSKMYESSGELVNHWYAAGQSKAIKKTKPQLVTIFEKPLVIWRLKDGSLSVMLDRCNHRNAPLSKGRVINDCLVCPYHGWTYNKEGQCVEIPSEGPHSERIPNKKIVSFPVKEAYGLVWVWMGKDKSPNSEPFEMPVMKEQGWHSYYMETKFSNTVTDLVENFMDVPHTVFVHKGWFRDRKQICINAKVERTADSVLVSYDQPNDSIGFSGWLVNPKGLPMKHTDNFYMPNITRVDYIFGENERGFIITSTCTPISPDETMVYTLISYKFGWLTPIAKMGLSAYTRKVINQDVWIMDIHGKNIRKFGETDYHSTQCDFMHLYIESLREHAVKDSKKLSPEPIIKDIEFWV
ncbi:aromatic ring-hydroxylating dioxygenase subunit alpha [Marivirga salinae]|uniref:Aromatic ring-hydroxylating dioxygenase subunit alpha n=1 Tax=Marivirga salinarum TaxID=3059078 RepID=A0AA51RCY1_9BACT|nr:aromatic ring-hydroxylating dioxygenase subunit alpha [Marivirga sp. BDSF4-3]WMN12318.1 aromatic ring-hydroxylating dioxygenase subunit alpha [Marivirga sp. BDSF4-3]